MEVGRKCRFNDPEAIGIIFESIWTEANISVCSVDIGRSSHTQALLSLKEELWLYEVRLAIGRWKTEKNR